MIKQISSLAATGVLAISLSACSGTPVGPVASENLQANPPSQASSQPVQAPAPTTTPFPTVELSNPHQSEAVVPAETNDAITIELNGDSASSTSENVAIDGSIVTISAAGSYSLSGTLDNGQIVVDSAAKEPVQLLLDGVSIHNESGAAIAIMDAEEVIVILSDGSENHLSDGANYVFPSAAEDEPNATLFSKADMSISGNGALTVKANYNDAISSKDGLIISGGNFTIDSVDDGIRGKDYLVIQEGEFTISAQGDGLKADNADDESKGYIKIEGGNLNIASENDAVQAETDLIVEGGSLNLVSGQGSGATLASDVSAKGLKAARSISINGGSFVIDSADDAIHTNGNIVINAGDFALQSGDDAIHADLAADINDGTIIVTRSYEGLESTNITINGGSISIKSSDDGINAAGSAASGGSRPGRPGNFYLTINGGHIVVDSEGDSIDSNGYVNMSAGTLIVNGPIMNMNAALDYDGSFTITGGLVIAAGSSGMAQTASEGSVQNALLINFDAVQEPGTLFHISDADGNEIVTFAPLKGYQSVAFSSPNLETGKSYTISLGGEYQGGSQQDGLYSGGNYQNGTVNTNFTVESTITHLGQPSRFNFRR
jgi:hypothetical protein